MILLFSFRSIAKELADWLIHNNVVEHIFGPNLHIEVRLLDPVMKNKKSILENNSPSFAHLHLCMFVFVDH